MTQSDSALSYFNHNGLEIIDCVLAIFLFELYRLFRSGRTLYSKDQFQFKILYFFSRLKLCRVIEDKSSIISACLNQNGETEFVRRSARYHNEVNNSDDGEGLCELIDQLNVECSGSKKEACLNCKVKTRENMKFKNLYKHLIEDIVKNIY